jgi:hypothetical protein
MTLSDDHRRVLAEIGQKGATAHRIAEIEGAQGLLSELLQDGYLREDEIPVEETGGPGRSSAGGVRVFYLTRLGAATVGLDPEHIGLS